ncbi:MAG: GAF domain-containing protein [Bacteroidales bacterium]|nr:GAF domain-containing protein [Bacteroidales bacterium]
MRDLINNLSIRSKLLLGFFVVTAIFFVLGIYQYNAIEGVNRSNELITFAKDMNSTSSQIKYLITKDMLVLRNFKFAKNDKELRALMKEHNENENKLKIIFASIINATYPESIDPMLRHNFRDTISMVQKTYTNDLCIAYTNIYNDQRIIVNPIEVKNRILQKRLDAKFGNKEQKSGDENIVVYGDVIQQEDDTPLEEASQAYIEDLQSGQNKNYQIITRIFGEIDKYLTMMELKSNSVIAEAMSISSVQGDANIKTLVIFLLIGIIVSLMLALYISGLIVKPLEGLMKYAKRLSEGELPEFNDEVYNDEVGQTASSIEQLTIGLQKTSDFAHAIGQGDFSSNYQPLSDKDVLGNSLLNMRKSLQNAAKEESKRKSEDIQRNWTTEGQALFAEILRHHTDDIRELSDDIVVNLVKYIKANQGGIFIYQDNDPNDIHLELLSAYAYNRKKFIKRRINIGEGLVGACAQEKYTIYLTDIPDDYIEIESGIGSANPKSLLIVPLRIENDILGVIELASFNEIKDFEIELVEKIAESIAATLSTTRINTRTAELLEQSNSKTQAMKDQEEEMRQTIEELQATQEDSMKREDDFYREIKEMEAINRTLEQQTSLQDTEIEQLKNKFSVANQLVKERENYENNLYSIISAAIITTTDDGTIQYVNDLFVNLLGYKSAEVLGRSVYNVLGFKSNEVEMAKALQAEFGNIVNMKGKEIQVLSKDGTPILFWLSVTANIFSTKVIYTLVLNDLSKLSEERKRSSAYEEDMLTAKFELENRSEILEDLLIKNKIELPGIDQDYTLLAFENYRIGLNIIDTQTRKWLESINKLYGDFKRKSPQKTVLQTLDELIDYTGYHFGFEEKYLKDFNYPRYDDFKLTHDQFIGTLRANRSNYANGETISLIKIIIFIKSWMSSYKPMLDEDFVRMFKANGLA